MPDDTRMPRPAPRDWADAFAALPLETPPGDAWAKIAAEIQPAAAAARPRRRRRPLWLAVAAAAALAVALPLFWRPTPDASPQPVAADRPAVSTGSLDPDEALRNPEHVEVAKAPDGRPSAIEERPGLLPASRPQTAGETKTPDAARTDAGARMAQRRATPARKPARPGAAVDSSDETMLAALYAQSAQLEDLLAMARDERVATGTAAALGDELDAKVAGIDAVLIQPGLDPQRRAELWRLRVDALQQLVGIEATQRLYAARGQSYDVALVSID